MAKETVFGLRAEHFTEIFTIFLSNSSQAEKLCLHSRTAIIISFHTTEHDG
jgi:hypothetical protein